MQTLRPHPRPTKSELNKILRHMNIKSKFKDSARAIMQKYKWGLYQGSSIKGRVNSRELRHI